ncbi:hypothetical protein HanPI659440_Chr02g0036571 [Helianthus annuus]|nr:hypothetical protein HanPI659440_Chr02g0036571 [Helianthus annuus]
MYQEPEAFMIDEFVTNIREFSTSVSGRNSPAAIKMFAVRLLSCYIRGMMGVVEKMGYAMSPKTVIVGDPSCEFRYSNDTHGISAAVALVIAVDRKKPSGIGETQFHAVLSSGLSPVGPTYKATSVIKRNMLTFTITARREGSRENIDGETILNQVYDEVCYSLSLGKNYKFCPLS